MDWIGECVDLAGSIGLLALKALFILMRDYTLDYPSFYSRLYAFLDRDVLCILNTEHVSSGSPNYS